MIQTTKKKKEKKKENEIEHEMILKSRNNLVKLKLLAYMYIFKSLFFLMYINKDIFRLFLLFVEREQ